MKKTKLLACLIAGALAVSLTACGNSSSSSSSDGTKAETQAGTNAPEESTTAGDTQTPEEVEASLDFEDGKFAFIAQYLKPADASEVELSVADFNGSKALQITNKGGKSPYVGIDVASLLGAKIADVAKVQMDIGVKFADGEFSAIQGRAFTWTGAELTETEYGWSVYMENKNPTRATFDITKAPFTADSKNIMIIGLNPASSADAAKAQAATLYIDNIAFYDANDKLIDADSAAEFDAPDGFAKAERDPKLWTLANPVTLENFAVSNSAWSQTGRELTDEEKALFVPGSIIEISYKCEQPVWLVFVGADKAQFATGNDWQRFGVVDPDGSPQIFDTIGNVDDAGTTVQFTYEQIVERLGEDFVSKIGQLQCEGQADWEIYSIQIGQKSNYTALTDVTELADFAVSNGAWSQSGRELTDEEKALFVPGSIIEVAYKCSEPVWMVCVGAEAFSKYMGNNSSWQRVGVVDPDKDFTTTGSVNADGDRVQFTYEQIVEQLGDNWLDNLAQLQCEGKEDWEVYGISIGKKAE